MLSFRAPAFRLLEAHQLAAQRGDATLFSGVSFQLGGGTALLVGGPNGSGKTTLLRIVAGVSEATGGTLHWDGKPFARQDPVRRAAVLFLGHAVALKDDFTAEENLMSMTTLHGGTVDRSAVREALAMMALSHQRSLPARV